VCGFSKRDLVKYVEEILTKLVTSKTLPWEDFSISKQAKRDYGAKTDVSKLAHIKVFEDKRRRGENVTYGQSEIERETENTLLFLKKFAKKQNR
jgi:hypothetical protein